MYNRYIEYLRNTELNTNLNFKSNPYNGILEHVTPQLGQQYLTLIQKEFSHILFSKVVDFCKINDTYGVPHLFKYSDELCCSPTSLRYVYHSLIILDHYSKKQTRNIVEVGCGYGGLCLAINYFMNDFNVKIENYHIVDFEEVGKLIKFYLGLHKEHVVSKIHYHSNQTFGENVDSDNLFFISNYCYTEIDKEYNKKYTEKLLPKTQSGFILWQNGGNNFAYPVNYSSEITGKNIEKICEERPQTDAGYDVYVNFFVYF